MAIKRKYTATTKKNSAKKLEVSNSKTKSANSKQTIRKKMNEFGDNDSL
jgi:hypothetical protein